MPQMDGLETTARLRRMPQGRVTPIVGTTASMSRLECLAAGMNDVMPKPAGSSRRRFNRVEPDIQNGITCPSKAATEDRTRMCTSRD
jgi:CheY-like chemotaxis protein